MGFRIEDLLPLVYVIDVIDDRCLSGGGVRQKQVKRGLLPENKSKSK